MKCSWEKIKQKPHASLEFLKKSYEKQIFFWSGLIYDSVYLTKTHVEYDFCKVNYKEKTTNFGFGDPINIAGNYKML